MQGLLGFGLLVLALEAIARSGLVHEYYFPPATRVFSGTWTLLTEAAFMEHVGATLYAAFLGLGLAVVIGVPLGVALGTSKVAYEAAYALIEVIRPIPSVALIPVVIIALGTGTSMKVLLIVLGAVWPVLFNTLYGIRNVDSVAKDTARVFGCGRVATLVRVSVPSAAPLTFTGIRIASAIALIIAISAEMLSGAQQGIGVWLLLAQHAGRPPELVFAGTFIAGLLGWAVNTTLDAGQHRFFRWAQPR